MKNIGLPSQNIVFPLSHPGLKLITNHFSFFFKDLLEYALSGLKCKIQSTQDNPSEMERYRRQQLHLEQDLSRVRSVLARNSKVFNLYSTTGNSVFKMNS